MTFSLGRDVSICLGDGKAVKQEYALGVAGSSILYSISQLAAVQTKVKIDLYDLSGAHVRTLVNGSKVTGQQYSVAVAGKSDFSAGTYLCTLNADGVTRSAKVFIK